MKMSEIWYKEWCPVCDAINWICDGDPTDLSGRDIDGMKCRKCGHVKYFGDDEMYEFDAEMGAWESVEDCYWVLGKEIPD